MFASVKINRRETFGEGSFSIVYSGTYNGVQAAVKTFKANGKLTEEILKAIEKESIMSSKFRHQNIINFYGKGTDSSTGHPVLVFERLVVAWNC
ncbi:hypothetical protein BCR33DRAFT_850834 [Rhizoclosmatium globosum]|uniref:Protein kinase domain-containing protein n=1 Tax=Rhizoclosmatium globosum TaxID=329046 RepID=A0A1Y2C9R1_9FUNG|nr:hypothetical protein BCR33DRAFT_850834 [Rhizoclosmatium globosum]|eukprot:ORY43594.1 hypothetical protein BCR33DRAFT_850834 [Rhizoclosmatium globosum]